ncbi:MAG: hypothetical protein FWG51_03310 [Firmicutes bacterium]|nr:hypothetical protein [Bacillota bacterium]
MNKVRKNLELISAIVSMIAGVFIIVACILSIITIKNFERDYLADLAIYFLIFEIIYAAVLIVFGALLCLIPYKSENFFKRKVFTIISIILFSILIFWYHLAMIVAFTPLALLMVCVCIAIVTMSAIALNAFGDFH